MTDRLTLEPEPLSLEELMFALLHVGQPAVAETVVGRMRRAGMTTSALLASLRAAQHSLVARGLLDVSSESLCDPLRTVAQGMTGAKASIGFRKPRAAAYVYLGPLGTFEQTVDDGVVHTLRAIEGPAAVLDRALDLFDIHDGHDGDCTEFLIPLAIFDGIKQTSDAEVRHSLEEAGVHADGAAAFAEDLSAASFRGDVVHATHDADGRPRVDAHMLVLHGLRRTWLVRPSDQAPDTEVAVVPSTPEVFRREIAAFLN